MCGQEIFRVEDGRFVEVWHLEDLSATLSQLKLGPPPARMIRLLARRSARRYRREQRGN